MMFIEAIAEIKKGRRVRRQRWNHLFYLWASNKEMAISLSFNNGTSMPYSFSVIDIESLDWEVEKQQNSNVD